MAVSRQEVLSKLTETEEAEFKAIEAKIDARLRTFDGSELLIDVRCSRRVADRLVAAYCAAGWAVTFEHGDQRDPGPWLRFR
jgi:hypothetical protein